MRSKEEIEQRLEEVRQRNKSERSDSTGSPCLPDGSADKRFIEAVSSRGYISALEWVLNDE